MKPPKGKSRKKIRIELPLPAAAPAPGRSPPPTPPPPPPPPPNVFPNYPSPFSTSSTPLPPPSMPKKRFLRRMLPFVLVGSAAYMYMKTPKKHDTEKGEKFDLNVSSIPSQSTETVSS